MLQIYYFFNTQTATRLKISDSWSFSYTGRSPQDNQQTLKVIIIVTDYIKNNNTLFVDYVLILSFRHSTVTSQKGEQHGKRSACPCRSYGSEPWLGCGLCHNPNVLRIQRVRRCEGIWALPHRGQCCVLYPLPFGPHWRGCQ